MEPLKKEKPSIFLSDTAPEIEKVQIYLLRKAGASKRMHMTLSLSQSVRNLSKRALRRNNPELGEFDLKILFIKNCYGAELAEKVKQHMLKRKPHG